MLDTGSLLFCLLGGLLALFVFSRGTERRHRYPPGPKGLPIVGNLFDVPKDYGWLTYQEWGRKYGVQPSGLKTSDVADHLRP